MDHDGGIHRWSGINEKTNDAVGQSPYCEIQLLRIRLAISFGKILFRVSRHENHNSVAARNPKDPAYRGRREEKGAPYSGPTRSREIVMYARTCNARFLSASTMGFLLAAGVFYTGMYSTTHSSTSVIM